MSTIDLSKLNQVALISIGPDTDIVFSPRFAQNQILREHPCVVGDVFPLVLTYELQKSELPMDDETYKIIAIKPSELEVEDTDDHEEFRAAAMQSGLRPFPRIVACKMLVDPEFFKQLNKEMGYYFWISDLLDDEGDDCVIFIEYDKDLKVWFLDYDYDYKCDELVGNLEKPHYLVSVPS